MCFLNTIRWLLTYEGGWNSLLPFKYNVYVRQCSDYLKFASDFFKKNLLWYFSSVQFSSVYLAKINYVTIQGYIVNWEGSSEETRRLMKPGPPSNSAHNNKISISNSHQFPTSSGAPCWWRSSTTCLNPMTDFIFTAPKNPWEREDNKTMATMWPKLYLQF